MNEKINYKFTFDRNLTDKEKKYLKNKIAKRFSKIIGKEILYNEEINENKMQKN